MRKIILALFVLSLCLTAAAPAAEVVKPAVQLVEPAITPATPPAVEGNEQILEPPASPTSEFIAPAKDKGKFGLERKTELTGSYLFQNLLLGTFALGGNLIMADSNHLGEKIGLAEDALEYKVGLGVALGFDAGNKHIFSIPLDAGATLYFKEGSLYGFDPFAGIGINLNLLGTDFKFGGMGYQLFGGILLDLGWGDGKTGIALGYNRLIVEGSRTSQGYYVSASQPIKL